MNTETKLLLLPSLIAIALLGVGCDRAEEHDDHGAEVGHAESDGHTHGAEEDEHAGEAGDGHGHDEHEEDVVRLTPEQLERAGVRIEPLAGGTITTHVTLPAEVGLNQDAVLHVTPRVPGIVSDVRVFLGNDVRAGDLLAVIESPELGEAKIAFLQAVQAKAIADAELDRQRTISDNTATLLDLLRQEPSTDELQERAADLRIGANKGRLLSAYARLRAAEANYAREKELRDRGLSTQGDLLAAQEAYNSNQADYFAAFEDVDFTFRLRFQEAERSAQVASSAVGNAERRLHLLGLTDEQVRGIETEPDINVSRYELTAPIGGRIVTKHITNGERVSLDEAVYTIANLDTVWLNISVYARYTDLIDEGQEVTVHAGDRTVRGVVDYISAVVSEDTRTVSARVVLPNDNRAWKPGEFVTVRVETASMSAARVVPIEAIQFYEGREVVFVQSEEGIMPVPVRIGTR
ncbi:MAG: efflux RND transporter periplasmic adaptor subunit, partial [Phycisphaerales bacterium]|nr:efflux RND transporter periplasmic adaptor subunit [Phycisphaerales bacterium]